MGQEHAKKVISYEIDENLKPVLSESLEGCSNIELTFKDVMKEKTEDIDKRFDKE